MKPVILGSTASGPPRTREQAEQCTIRASDGSATIIDTGCNAEEFARIMSISREAGQIVVEPTPATPPRGSGLLRGLVGRI